MKKLLIVIALSLWFPFVAYAGPPGSPPADASTLALDTANFDGELSPTENTLQLALDALDDVVGVGDTTETNQDDAWNVVPPNTVTGTQTFITVTYQDATNDVDFVVPVLNEDDMATDSDTYLATQQSIKAYVDAQSLALTADSVQNSHIDWADLDNLGEEGALTVADTADTTSFVGLFESATGDLAAKTDTGLTYNAATGVLTATGFVGPITGDVTGAVTAVTVADTTDTTSFIGMFESADGDLGPKTDLGLTYNAGTGVLTATGFAGPITGALTGNADTATLAAALTISDNESENENNAVVFLPGGDLDGGDLALESDGTFYYNPSTGIVTSTGFAGALTGNVTGDASGNSGTVTIADAANDTTTWVLLGTGATGSLAPATDASITYNANTGELTATGFTGDLTGNADTVTIADAANDTTTSVLLGTAATGSLAPATDASLTYNANTGALTATSIVGTTDIETALGAAYDTSAELDDLFALKANLTSPVFLTSMEIPNGTSGTTDATGEIYLDTDGDGAEFDGPILQISTNDATVGYIVSTAGLPGTAEDNFVQKYDATSDTVSWEADADSGGAPVLNAVVSPAAAWAITAQDTENITWTVETTATDFFTIDATGTFGASDRLPTIFLIESTGNPTNGTLLTLKTADNESEVYQLVLADFTDDYVTHKIAEDGTYTINVTTDSGAATIALSDSVSVTGDVTTSGSFIIGLASMNETDLEKLDGITNGTQAASKAVVTDSNTNSGISKVSQLHIGTSGSETQVTSTAAELNILDNVTATYGEINYLDITTLGTTQSSKVLTLAANGNLTSSSGTWDMTNVTGITLSADEIVDAEVVNALTVTAQAGSTWNVADSITALSVYTGTTSLDETTAANDSGAYIIGVFDEFTNSNSTNVQDVLDDLDGAITGGATVYSSIGEPVIDASSISFTATQSGTYTSSADLWVGMFITNTHADLENDSELLTLTYTDADSTAGNLNFLSMIANSVTLVEFTEDGLALGTGTPTNALDGGDVYITDDLEVDGTVTLGALTVAGSATPIWTWNDSDASGGTTAHMEAMQINANLSTPDTDDEIADWWITYMHDDGIANDSAAPLTSLLWDGSTQSMYMGVLTDGVAGTEVAGYESLRWDFYDGGSGIVVTSPSSSTIDFQISTVTFDALVASGAVTLGSATEDSAPITLIQGAQSGDPQVILDLTADASGDFSVTTDTGDILLVSAADITLTGANLKLSDGVIFQTVSDADSITLAANGEATFSQEIQASGGVDATGQTIIATTFSGNASTATAAASQVITDNALVTVDDAAGAVDNEYARFTAAGLESRTPTEMVGEFDDIAWTFGAVAVNLSAATVTMPASQALTTPAIGAATGTSIGLSDAGWIGIASNEIITFNAAGTIVASGAIFSSTGGVAVQTPLSGSTTDFAGNFTGAYLYGGTYVATSDTGDLVLPVMAAGMNFTIITAGAIEVVIDTNAADGYLMDGTTNAEGKALTNLSTAGDIAVIQYYDASDWLITTNGWTPEA